MTGWWLLWACGGADAPAPVSEIERPPPTPGEVTLLGRTYAYGDRWDWEGSSPEIAGSRQFLASPDRARRTEDLSAEFGVEGLQFALFSTDHPAAQDVIDRADVRGVLVHTYVPTRARLFDGAPDLMLDLPGRTLDFGGSVFRFFVPEGDRFVEREALRLMATGHWGDPGVNMALRAFRSPGEPPGLVYQFPSWTSEPVQLVGYAPRGHDDLQAALEADGVDLSGLVAPVAR